MVDGTTIFMIVRVLILGFLLWLLYRLLRSFISLPRGDKERTRRFRRPLINFIIAFVLLWPLTGIRLQKRYLEWHHRPQLYEIAKKLGYTAKDLLVEGASCHDGLMTILFPILYDQCTIFLVYTTDLEFPDLKPLATQFSADLILDEQGTSPNLFPQINMHTAAVITINGSKDPGTSDSLLRINNYGWTFYSEKDVFQSFQSIELYESSHVAGLAFNGKPIVKNIIVVELHFNRVYLY